MLTRFFVLMLLLTSSYGLLGTDFSQPDDALTTEIVANDRSDACDDTTVDTYLSLESVDNYENASIWTHGEKIYVNPERIISTNQGLLLNLNNQDYVVLPLVYSDGYGYYIERTARIPVASFCPLCGKKYVGNCLNKDCPGREKIRKFEQEKKDKKRAYKERRQQEKKDKKKKRDHS